MGFEMAECIFNSKKMEPTDYCSSNHGCILLPVCGSYWVDLEWLLCRVKRFGVFLINLAFLSGLVEIFDLSLRVPWESLSMIISHVLCNVMEAALMWCDWRESAASASATTSFVEQLTLMERRTRANLNLTRSLSTWSRFCVDWECQARTEVQSRAERGWAQA